MSWRDGLTLTVIRIVINGSPSMQSYALPTRLKITYNLGFIFLALAIVSFTCDNIVLNKVVGEISELLKISARNKQSDVHTGCKQTLRLVRVMEGKSSIGTQTCCSCAHLKFFCTMMYYRQHYRFIYIQLYVQIKCQ